MEEGPQWALSHLCFLDSRSLLSAPFKNKIERMKYVQLSITTICISIWGIFCAEDWVVDIFLLASSYLIGGLITFSSIHVAFIEKFQGWTDSGKGTSPSFSLSWNFSTQHMDGKWREGRTNICPWEDPGREGLWQLHCDLSIIMPERLCEHPVL